MYPRSQNGSLINIYIESKPAVVWNISYQGEEKIQEAAKNGQKVGFISDTQQEVANW